MAQTNRKRKRKNANSYLYIAITLFIVVAALFVAILCIAFTSCNDGETTISDDVSVESNTSNNESSFGSNVESSNESINVDNSKPQTESSTVIDESSNTVSEGVPKTSEEYEKYIGVDYVCDIELYEQYICPENEEDFVFLVNPSHTLASDYVPENLVKCTNIRKGRPDYYSYIDATANKALEAFLIEAAYYGFDDITVTNAYRSYSTQADIFNNYVANDLKSDYKCDNCNYYIDVSYYKNKVATAVGCSSCGGEVTDVDGESYCTACMSVADKKEVKVCADCGHILRRPTKDETIAHVLTYSTRPGTSEHQSGLCCDMHNLPDTTSKFDNTPEANWLAENAHRFGFILRYPPNTQHITGIKHESWHFRYVGRTAATEMYEKGLTLDEYCQ